MKLLPFSVLILGLICIVMFVKHRNGYTKFPAPTTPQPAPTGHIDRSTRGWASQAENPRVAPPLPVVAIMPAMFENNRPYGKRYLHGCK